MKIYLEKPSVSYYSLFIFIGGLIALVIMYFSLAYKKHLKFKKYLLFVYLYLMPGIIYFVLFAWLLDNTFHYLNGEEFGSSGVSFLGGCLPLMFLFLVILVLNKRNEKVKNLLNVTIMIIPLVHCFGRLGCFFSGCCFGIPCNFGVVYWEGSNASELYGYGTAVLPTQIIEAVFCFVLFLFLCFKLKNNRFFYYTVIYGVYRFFAEFLRGDNRGVTGLGITPSQLMSLLLVLSGVIYYFLFMYKNKFEDELIK